MSIKHFCVQWLFMILITMLISRGIEMVSDIPFRQLFALLH